MINNDKLVEMIVNALLPQLKLDVSKPEESVKIAVNLYKTIENAVKKETHIEAKVIGVSKVRDFP
jgi:hypothetical protein